MITPIPVGSECEFLWYFGFAMFVCLFVGIIVILIFGNVFFLYPVGWLVFAIICALEVLDNYEAATNTIIAGWRNLVFGLCTWIIRFFRKWILWYA